MMMMMMMHSGNKKNNHVRLLLSSLVCACLLGMVAGFFGGQKAKPVAAPKISPRTQEAVDIWDATYPFNRQPIQQDDSVLDKIGNFGVPQMDLDGTKVFKAAAFALRCVLKIPMMSKLQLTSKNSSAWGPHAEML